MKKTRYTNQTISDVIIYTTLNEKIIVPSFSSIEINGEIKRQKFLSVVTKPFLDYIPTIKIRKK